MPLIRFRVCWLLFNPTDSYFEMGWSQQRILSSYLAWNLPATSAALSSFVLGSRLWCLELTAFYRQTQLQLESQEFRHVSTSSKNYPGVKSPCSLVPHSSPCPGTPTPPRGTFGPKRCLASRKPSKLPGSWRLGGSKGTWLRLVTDSMGKLYETMGNHGTSRTFWMAFQSVDEHFVQKWEEPGIHRHFKNLKTIFFNLWISTNWV